MAVVYDFSRYDPIEVFRAIYENCRPLGLGIFQFDSNPLSIEEATKIYEEHRKHRSYFDYVKGRCIKVDFSSFPNLDFRLPIRDYGNEFPEKVFAYLKRIYGS